MKLILLILICVNAFANEALNQRIESLYSKTDKSYDLQCYYYSPKKSNLSLKFTNQTVYLNKSLTRDYILNNGENNYEMRVNVSQPVAEETFGKYDVTINGKSYTGSITNSFYKGFYIKSSFDDFDKSIEVNQIYCRVNIAKAPEYKIVNSMSKIHINVHPHLTYDWRRETTEKVQKLIDSGARKNIVLIEESVDEKGHLVNLKEFLETGVVPELPKSYYYTPLSLDYNTDLIISPAGHNRYLMNKTSGELNVLYTGGFHNYCVWNNTRNILASWFRSDSKVKMNINYKLDSLIVQRVGVISKLSFNWSMLRRTRLLENLVNKNQSFMKRYFKRYYEFFSGPFIYGSTFGSFLTRFKTLKITYKSPLYENSVLIQGKGERELELDINYL